VSARAPRARDRARAIANFARCAQRCPKDFGEGTEISTRGACAPQSEVSHCAI